MDKLKAYAQHYGIACTQQNMEQFACYEALLLQWNQKINLTGITEHDAILIKHFLDSMLVSTLSCFRGDARIIDVGTGAGFPGIPLKILYPDLQLTLLDSLNKRIQFLSAVCAAIGHTDVACIHGRAEEFAHQTAFREQFDCAVARAVASLPALCEYCLPFVRQGGYLIAMKGAQIQEEAMQANEAIKKLGGELTDIQYATLPNGDGRSFVIIQKQHLTPEIYPRKATKINKYPIL